MSPINILIYVCLLSSPDVCEERSIPMSEAGSLSQCYYWAQPHIAAWSTTHPKYKIMKWTCASRSADGEPI